jgi:hypothetical protein
MTSLGHTARSIVYYKAGAPLLRIDMIDARIRKSQVKAVVASHLPVPTVTLM